MTDPLEEMARDFCEWWAVGSFNDVSTRKSCREDAINELKNLFRTLRSKTRKEDAEIAEFKTMTFKGAWITNDVREFREQIAQAILKKDEEAL